MSTIKQWLTWASCQLKSIGIETDRLDAEIILACVLERNRTYLHAHSDDKISQDIEQLANSLLTKRLDRFPIAYITGQKEFYGRTFFVNESVLIPRPESETIIDVLREVMPNKDRVVLFDVGTGSGILGITAKLEFPFLDVTLSDISLEALEIANKNALTLKADVNIIPGNLLKAHATKADVILANLPYVDINWPRSPETKHEPSSALFANENGMELINQLILDSAKILNDKGYLIIEADPTQHNSLIQSACCQGLGTVKKRDYVLAFKKLDDISANTVK